MLILKFDLGIFILNKLYELFFVLVGMKKVIGVLGILMLVVFAGLVLGADSDAVEVSVNVLAPEPDVVGIKVPDSLDFGNVTKGEESDIMDLYINNTGNVAVTVTPELANDSEEIFSYLFFRRTQSQAFSEIGSFSVNISEPADGGIKTQRTYVMLDLTDFDGNDSVEYKSDVIFWAVAQ